MITSRAKLSKKESLAPINASLARPSLAPINACGITFYTDEKLFEQTGVRVAFIGKTGGVSEDVFASLNLGNRVGDDPAAVAKNRALAIGAIAKHSGLRASEYKIVNPKQVHKDDLVVIRKGDDVDALAETEIEADGVVCEAGVKNVAALLCFADCVPVIMATPSGAFAVVHAGWRGVVNKISQKALLELAKLSNCETSEVNVYVGPHLRQCCFEVGDDTEKQFADAFGREVIDSDPNKYDKPHVSMEKALVKQLTSVGADTTRILDVEICTQCSPVSTELFYSYRKSGGKCGRHGALAFAR